jgi:hypothetical protein
MTLTERIDALVALGEYIGKMEGRLEFVIRQAKLNNGWFTVENTKLSLKAIETEFLEREKLTEWVNSYDIKAEITPKKVGLILAGNIPLVGFQDVMNTFMAGHHALIKCSDKDFHLMRHFVKVLSEINPATENYFTVIERLAGFDAVIATGSNNTARYFETYFKKYPNIIRKNRNSIGVIDGNETDEDFRKLADDIFNYFGLGCRNVAKVYVPEGYDFNHLLEIFHERKLIVNHGKYKNNFDYNIAFHILNRTEFYNNGSIIMIKNESLQSRIAQLHYEYYTDKTALSKELAPKSEQIQCIVGNNSFDGIDVIPFGTSQTPTLYDYADGVDVMEFLKKL